MTLAIVALLFGLGLVLGSFINVVIYRTIHGEQWVKGRSRCDECGHQIAWYDNIPLLSFLILGGRCRYCRKKIAPQHFAIELMTGILMVWWYLIGFAFFKLTEAPYLWIQPVFWLIVGILLLVILVTDWLYQIIPDFANLALLVLSLLYRAYLTQTGAMQAQDFKLALATGLGLALFLGLLWWITRGRGMGLGDVKFAVGMGILLGWPRGLVGMFAAFVFGAIVGSILIGLKLKKFKEKIAFGPFLILGTGLALVWGNEIWEAYLKLIWG